MQVEGITSETCDLDIVCSEVDKVVLRERKCSKLVCPHDWYVQPQRVTEGMKRKLNTQNKVHVNNW